jgi:hypothetical protein
MGGMKVGVRTGERVEGRSLLRAWLVCLVLLGACHGPAGEPARLTPVPVLPTSAPSETPAGALSDAQVRTLSSLRLVDPYPLYTMHYAAPYGISTVGALPASYRWSCSLFAALGDPSSRLYGRNFDWDYSPAVLLFTDPPGGYASMSMVDIAYVLGDLSDATALNERPAEALHGLLWAPHLPFDGMNEHGLVVGMASVPISGLPYDPALPTVDELELIRWMLDRSRTVDEAVQVLRSANVSWGGGPPVHYLIADAGGHSALVEYVEGRLVVLPNTEPWHLATNFHVSSAGEGPVAPAGFCTRYDRMLEALRTAGGVLHVDQGLDLLRQVSTERTQWSVVYDLSQLSVHVVMGRGFETVYTFDLGE